MYFPLEMIWMKLNSGWVWEQEKHGFFNQDVNVSHSENEVEEDAVVIS